MILILSKISCHFLILKFMIKNPSWPAIKLYNFQIFKVPLLNIQTIISWYSNYHFLIFKLPFLDIQTTISWYSKYHFLILKLPFPDIETPISWYSNYHFLISKLPFPDIQTTIPLYSNYHFVIFKQQGLPLIIFELLRIQSTFLVINSHVSLT